MSNEQPYLTTKKSGELKNSFSHKPKGSDKEKLCLKYGNTKENNKKNNMMKLPIIIKPKPNQSLVCSVLESKKNSVSEIEETVQGRKAKEEELLKFIMKHHKSIGNRKYSNSRVPKCPLLIEIDDFTLPAINKDLTSEEDIRDEYERLITKTYNGCDKYNAKFKR